jgi:hypothetical protein
MKQDIGPGPSNYTPNIDATKPNGSMNVTIAPPSECDASQRLFEQKVAITPGPGSYNMDQSFNKTKGEGPSFSISKTAFRKEDWNKVEQMKYPGPAEYNPDKDSTRARPQTAFISKTQRKTLFERKDMSPGPDAYNLNESYSQRGAIFVGRGKLRKSDITPGPGQYSSLED